MRKVRLTELGMLGNGGLRAEVEISGFVFAGETDAWPGSVTYQKFMRVVDVLCKQASGNQGEHSIRSLS